MKRMTILTCTLAALAMVICTYTPRPLMAATVLDPSNPNNFTRDGNQNFTPGAVLTFTDNSIGDFVTLFAQDSDAPAGVDTDVVATFQVRVTGPSNADADNRVVINDGVTRAAIAACVIVNGMKGIGLLSQGPASDPASYPVFVPADWQAAPVTVRLRRTAAAMRLTISVFSSPDAEEGCRADQGGEFYRAF